MINVDIKKIAFAIIILVGLAQVVRVYGLDERSIAIFESISYVTMIIIVAAIALFIYKHAVVRILGWFDESVEDGHNSSLYPLLSVMGTLIITVACIWVIMSYLGIDVLVILTSAGIVGLAITFGAQSTLSQFFSGLNILMSRPFKVGDVIRLDNTHITYRVKKIGLMNTILEEWDSREPYSFPNNKLSNSVVDNVTTENEMFWIVLYVDILYDSDLNLARDVMMDALKKAPRVVLDGSVPGPAVWFVDTTTTHVHTKVSCFGECFADNSPIINGIVENLVIGLRDANIGFKPIRYDINVNREE